MLNKIVESMVKIHLMKGNRNANWYILSTQ